MAAQVPERASLDVPAWVPASVKEKATRYRAATNNPEVIAVLQRLVSDRRMRTVWIELKKRKRLNHRATASFHHPVRDRSVQGNTAADRQDAAMQIVFEMAVDLALRGFDALVRIKTHPKANKWRRMSGKLREDADHFRHVLPDSFSDRLLDAASVYGALNAPFPSDEVSEFLDSEDETLVRVQERECTRLVAALFHQLFKKRFSTLTARLTSVILEREVNPNTVTVWCRDIPVMRTSDI